MVTSMTGFGQAERSFAGFRLQIDLKSVNHRYCEVAVRMPREFGRYESTVKQAIQQHVKRGRVDVFVTVERDPGAAPVLEVDWTLAGSYRQAADSLRAKLALSGELTLHDLLALPGIVAFRDKPDVDDEALEAELAACAAEAAIRLAAMRNQEGAALQEDLSARLLLLDQLLEQAGRLAPQVVKDYAAKLKLRIREMLEQPEPDEARLALEVALLADRSSIDEELTRLKSHLGQFSRTLEEREPVGRKLDFLVQEMNREVNTIGSKANHAELAGIVLGMKAELEKVREQIQNIE
ncbi:TIGR00255 family protein [Paenibacillus sp. UNCCL117]|uniref:YicC/YloC family endoribonuclease n=1 Tax=unclassified Paenibacillus TaxID=185978 RepID=UPI000892123F|nr:MULTISPECIES: YicC/YloC family endoribonuclease [unclassified Paenibacillus]SDD98670.1 TIGR00255 family protein [Paenibacillus sp. cl123]SFW55899.1 TIGR00255 family protein [Paenibacillus sp. UNCCL117]